MFLCWQNTNHCAVWRKGKEPVAGSIFPNSSQLISPKVLSLHIHSYFQLWFHQLLSKSLMSFNDSTAYLLLPTSHCKNATHCSWHPSFLWAALHCPKHCLKRNTTLTIPVNCGIKLNTFSLLVKVRLALWEQANEFSKISLISFSLYKSP